MLNALTPLPGTAPVSTAWLIVYHQGSWGERPVDTIVPQNLKDWAHDRDAKILLARTPVGRDTFPVSTYWYSTSHGHLVQGMLDPSGLPDLKLAHSSHSLLLICTNGKRDQCCATLGRNLITQCRDVLSPKLFEQILECSHLGGHRFAPTAIWLPDNLVLGRLDAPAVAGLLDNKVIDTSFIRGDSRLTAAQQVVHAHLWPQEIEFLSEQEFDAEVCVSAVVNGEAKEFLIQKTTINLVASCGTEPVESTRYQLSVDSES